MTQSVPPPAGTERPSAAFSARGVEVLSALSCVTFRRELSPSGDIRYPWISDNVSDILGIPAHGMTVTGRGALNAMHWADRDTHLEAIRRSAKELAPCQEAFRAITAAGETRWFRGSAVPEAQPDGSVRWDGAWIDISPWMRAENQFQTVMGHVADAIITLDASHRIDWMNAAALRLFDYELEMLTGRCLSALIAMSDCDPIACLVTCPAGKAAACFSLGSQEIIAARRDGTTFPFEMTVSELRSDGQLSLMVIGRDITRRKATEAQLEETEHRLRTIAANLPGVVFQRVQGTDGNFSCSYVSEGIREITGREPDDFASDPALMFDMIIPSDRQRLLEALAVSAQTLGPAREDVRVVGPQGRLRWLRGQSRPRRRGDAIVWDGLILDVTDEVEERVRAETAVRESEERFRLAFAAASLGIVVVAQDGTIQKDNPAFVEMTGGAPVEGANFFAFVERAHLPFALSEQGASFCFDYAPRLPDGVERHWRITGTLFAASPDAPALSLLFLIEDITEMEHAAAERRQLELALQEGHKLEALGRLAGGVAHELNNMLGPILMAAEMLERSLPLDQRNAERCSRIIEAAKHGRDIVRNVLAYCRKEQKALAPIELGAVVRQFTGLAASTLPPTIRVECRIEAEAAEVLGDAGQLQQVLLNLANNARDAMDGHGTLLLALRHAGPEDLLPPRPAVEQRRFRPGESGPTLPNPFANLDPERDHVELRIADTGCGMSPAVQAKIFDPFFTTKPVGQGTGLGLSVVQGIIKAMGGAIAIESEPGIGTVFRIVLPLMPGGAAA